MIRSSKNRKFTHLGALYGIGQFPYFVFEQLDQRGALVQICLPLQEFFIVSYVLCDDEVFRHITHTVVPSPPHSSITDATCESEWDSITKFCKRCSIQAARLVLHRLVRVGQLDQHARDGVGIGEGAV